MNRKRDRSPSASADESTKLCLIWRSEDYENPDDEKSSVYAMILDPNLQTADADTITTDEDGFILNAQPSVRFDDWVAFCVSKSTLYIIDSFLSDRLYSDGFLQIEDKDPDPVKKTVYSFVLAQFDSNTVVVQKSELLKLPDMHGGKVDPDAVVTPDGKIVVFSRAIYDFSDSSDMVEFEVYDPDTREWSKLPPLFHHNIKYAIGSVGVWGSGFLSSSVYFVSTSRGNHVIDLDLEENERSWKKYEPLGRSPYMNDIYFIGEEGVCLTNYTLTSTRDWGTHAEFYQQISSFPEYIEKGARYVNDMGTKINRLSTLMSKVDGRGCFKFCSIQAVHHKGGLGLSSFWMCSVATATSSRTSLSLPKKHISSFLLRIYGI